MDGITFGYLGWRAWRYLQFLCEDQGTGMNSAQALAHARTCPACVYWLAEIAAGRRVQRVRSGAETVVLTKVMTAVAS